MKPTKKHGGGTRLLLGHWVEAAGEERALLAGVGRKPHVIPGDVPHVEQRRLLLLRVGQLRQRKEHPSPRAAETPKHQEVHKESRTHTTPF